MMPGSTSTYNQNKTKHLRDRTESATSRRNLFTDSNSNSNSNRREDNANLYLKRSLDEQRQHVARLKNELDLEKERTKQLYRNQVTEMKRVRDECSLENTLNLEANSREMKRSRDLEAKKLKETLAREKDLEIKQIIKFKDEEIRTMQKTLLEEHEKILKNTEGQYRRKLAAKGKMNNEDLERKLRQELMELKQSKEELEISYRSQVGITNEKKEQIVKIKAEFEKETQKLTRENQKEHLKLLAEIKQLRKALQEQTSAAEKSNAYAARLIEEKQDLAKRLKQDRINLQEKSLNSMDSRLSMVSGTPNQMEKDRGLQSKNAELRRQLEEANKKIKQYEKESNVLHSTPVSHGGPNAFTNSSVADKKSIKVLKRRNAELVAIAKKLEEKGLKTQKELDDLKGLKLSNSDMLEDSDSINNLRKSFAIKRAKDLAENARLLLQKDKQIEELRYTKKNVVKEGDDAEKKIMNNHDGSEYLHLQTELSSALEKNQNISVELDHLRDTHSTCDEYMEELINKQNELKSLAQKLAEKEEECTSLSTSILKKDKEMSYLQKEIKDKEFQCCRLIEEADSQRSHIKELEESILAYKEQKQTLKWLQEERDQLNSLLLDANNYSNKLEEEIDKLQNQIDSIKNTVLDQQDKIKVLTNENTQAKEKLLEREAQIAELHKVQEESLVSYNNSVSSLKDDLRSIEAKYNKLESNKRQVQQAGSGKNGFSQSYSSIYTQTGFEAKDFCAQFPMDNENNGSEKRGNDSYSLFVPSSKKRRNHSSRRRSMSPTDNDCSEIDVTDFSIASNDIFDIAGRRIHELEASDSEDELNSENRLTLHPSSSNKRINGFLSNDELSIEEIDISDGRHDQENINQHQFFDIPVLYNRFRKLTHGCENLFRLYIAKYTYDPSLYSPNEDHELELPLEAGMQIYVYGEMDEDGFYLAESKTGNRGLVPSNLVELVGDGLSITRLEANTGDQITNDYGSDEDTVEVPPLDEEAMQHLSEIPIPDEYLQQSPKTTSAEALGSVQESVEKIHDVVEVPAPRSLCLDRQLNNSTVMCWQSPIGIKQCKIKGYSIYVDGKKRQTILGSSRTKALVSDIDQKQAYRISVHTLTINGDESRDELAVVTVGTGPYIHAPYDLKVRHVKSLTADLCWKPSNSSYYHAVYKNNENITTLEPGVCKYSLHKLIPDKVYSIKVESRKYISKPTPPDWSRYVEFRTTLGIKPDPPLYVCGEVKRDHLQVSWLPVTINEDLGSSNGSIVTGYSVYVDEEQCATVKSPTSDTVNIPLWKFSNRLRDPGKDLEVSVRTQSTAGESDNSNISVVDVNIDTKPISTKLVTSPQDGKHTSPSTNETECYRINPVKFSEPDLDRLEETVIDDELYPCVNLQKQNGSCHSNEVSLDASDPDYNESLNPTWSEIGVAFNETDSIETRCNNKIEPTSDFTEEDRLIISDGELSVIEEVSEPESVLTARLLECSAESAYENSLSACNMTEPLKLPKPSCNKLSKSEPIEIHKVGRCDHTVTESYSSSRIVSTNDSLDPETPCESAGDVGSSTNSSTKTYTIRDSYSDENSKSAGHTRTSHLDQNHNSTFTLSSCNESEGNECKDDSAKRVISNCSSHNDTYTLLPGMDHVSPKEKSEQVSSNVGKSNSASSCSPASKSTLSNSDSNSIMDDSLIESVQMSSMKLSGIIASQVSELSSQLSSIVFSCDSDDEAISLPVDEVRNVKNSLAINSSNENTNVDIGRTVPNDSKRVETETNAIAVDDHVKTVEVDSSKAVIELLRDSNHALYASGELDTSRAVTDLAEDSSKCSRKESQSSKRISSPDNSGVYDKDETNMEEEGAAIEIPEAVSVAQRICEFENQKEHLKMIKSKSNSLPSEDSLKNDISSLSNGYHSSCGESGFSDDVFSAPKVKPKPKPKRRTYSLTETIDVKEKYIIGSKDDICTFSSNSSTKIGFIDANKINSTSQNKLTIKRSLHSNDTDLSDHVLSNGISDYSSDEDKVKSCSDEEIKLEIFNVPKDTPNDTTPATDNNLINESYIMKNNRTNSKGSSLSNKESGSSKSSCSNHTESQASSDEYVVNEEHSVTSDQTTLLYNSQINGDGCTARDEILQDSRDLDRPFVINKPIKDLYSFGGNIDISSSEHELSESINDVSDSNNLGGVNCDRTTSDVNDEDGNDDFNFNVTQINDMEESTVSRISTVRTDSEKNSKSSENANEVLKQIDENGDGNLFQCSSPVDSQTVRDGNLIFECPLPEEYQKEYDEESVAEDLQKCRVFVANFSYDPLTMSPNVELVEDELAFLTGDLIKVYGEIGIDGFYFGELNGKRGYIPGNMITEVDNSTSELKKLETLTNLTNGDSFFDLSTGNRINTEPSGEVESVDLKNQVNIATTSSRNTSATKLRENISAKRVINSKSSSTNNLSRDSGEDFVVDTQAKSNSMPNVSSDFFDKLEYEIDDDEFYNPPDPYLLKPTCMISLFPYDPATSSPNVDAEIELSFNAGEIIEVYGEMDEDGFFAGKLNNVKGLVPSNFVRKATEKEILKGFSATSANMTNTSGPKKKTSLFKKSKKIFSRLKGSKVP